jgi:hypothetical protein
MGFRVINEEAVCGVAGAVRSVNRRSVILITFDRCETRQGQGPENGHLPAASPSGGQLQHLLKGTTMKKFLILTALGMYLIAYGAVALVSFYPQPAIADSSDSGTSSSDSDSDSGTSTSGG